MRSRWIWGLLLALALGLLLSGWPGAAPAWRRLLDMGAGGWTFGALGLLASHALRAGRLHAEWGARAGVDVAEAWRVTVWHHAAVNLLPMRSGELGYPFLLRKRWQVPLGDSAGSLLWMRLQDACVLAGLAVWLLAAVAMHRGRLTLPFVLAIDAVAAGAVLVLAVRGAAWAEAMGQRTVASGWRWFRLQSVCLAICRGGARSQPATWAWCLGNWMVKLGTLGWLLAVATGAPWLATLTGALSGEVAAVLPLQPPGGFGAYEAAVAFGIGALHAAPVQELLGAALALHLFVIAVACAAAVLAWCAPGASVTAMAAAAHGAER
jgi:hypothetical protein